MPRPIFVRPLTDDERRLVPVLDRTGVVLGLANWLRWLYREDREFDDRAAVAARMAELVLRAEIWASVERAASDALAAAGAAAHDLDAIGIANQRETTIVWERRSGRPVPGDHHLDRGPGQRCIGRPGQAGSRRPDQQDGAHRRRLGA